LKKIPFPFLTKRGKIEKPLLPTGAMAINPLSSSLLSGPFFIMAIGFFYNLNGMHNSIRGELIELHSATQAICG
jgi:hypothetical protein